MNTAGIIAEFNPFHNGHRYLVDCVRESGAECVAAVMGGSFLQRGECAVIDKFSRAEAAVLGGVDIVFELPQVFACASAEVFAFGGAEVLKACGAVDTLCFGSECGDAESLLRAQRMLQSLSVAKYTSKGYSYARAFRAAAEDKGLSEAAKLLDSPNNTLALEYIKASDGAFDIFTVERTAAHNDGESGAFASASVVRRLIFDNDDTYLKYVPETTAAVIEREMKAGRCPAALQRNERGVLSVLRRMSAEELSTLPGVSEGLENRFLEAIRSSDTIEGILTQVKCKRYTHTRLSRTIACAYLGIKKEDVTSPQYIRVLAFNDRGAELLKKMKTTATLPVVMNARDIKALKGDAARMIDLDIKATDLFALCTPTIQPCGDDYYKSAVKRG